MSNPNKAPRDPITGKGSAPGSVSNASAGRIKSISGGGPAFTKNPGASDAGRKTSGWPVPNNPYK